MTIEGVLILGVLSLSVVGLYFIKLTMEIERLKSVVKLIQRKQTGE